MPKIFLHCLCQIGEKFCNSVRYTSLAQPIWHMASTVNVFNSNNVEKNYSQVATLQFADMHFILLKTKF